MTMMMRTMMDAGARRPGRSGGWRASRGLPDGRAALLAALADYRRGAAEAPVVCKRGAVLRQAQDERTEAMPGAAGLPSLYRVRARNDNWRILRQAQDERTEGMPGAAGLPSLYRVRARDDTGRVLRQAQDERFWNGDGSDKAGAGPLVFVASTGEVDRHGDTVAPEGWRLDAYRDNPVVLWAHDYGEPAIGRAEAVWSDGRDLRARLEFAPTEFAGQVERLYRQGYQKGVSVGFRPLRFEERRDPVNGAFLGIRFLEQELLEISAVPVPANGGALLAEDAPGSASAPAETARALDEVVGLLRGLRN